MGDKEDKEKAEKLAAAKKRVAQLKKKKAGTSEKPTSSAGLKSEASTKDRNKEEDDADEHDTGTQAASKIQEDGLVGGKQDQTQVQGDRLASQDIEGSKLPAGDGDDDETAFFDAIKAANAKEESMPPEQDKLSNTSPDAELLASNHKHTTRQPSISLQSKIRSTSFRHSGPLSPSTNPEGTDDSLYRKQAQRIEELESENAKLAEEASEGDARWRKSEEELEELREKATNERSSTEVEKLREELNSLRRSARASISAGAGRTRQASNSQQNEDLDNLRRDLEGKDSTISDLQLELSRVRSRASAQTEGCEAHGEQIAALQANLKSAEASVTRLEAELAESRHAVTRLSEKSVVDGSEQVSRETKIKALERENEQLKLDRGEFSKKVEGLEKKVEAMTKLHRETEQRNTMKLSAADAQVKESQMLKSQIEGLEREIVRLKGARKRALSGVGGDDGLEELEDEERNRLERRVRELEGEVFEHRRGIWRDKRKELQPGMIEGEDGDEFDDVDLSGSGAKSRTRSTASQGPFRQHSGFTQVLSSGLAAFTSSNGNDGQQTRSRNDSLLQDFDDDAFDEHEFARLQREEELKKMVEHVREVKRGLKKWTGWRLDLVDARRGGGGWGVGEVFDV